MQQKRTIYFACGARSQFFMRAVQRISGLERDDVRAAESRESFTHLNG
jgi:hypothetical protein